MKTLAIPPPVSIPSFSIAYSPSSFGSLEENMWYPKPEPSFTAELYKCRRTDENRIKIRNNKSTHFFYGYGGYNSCSKCEDRLVCSGVCGIPASHAKLVSKTVPLSFQLLLFKERQLTETFTVGRFRFEKKIINGK